MPRFLLQTECEVGGEVALRGADVRHVTRVLRLGPGDLLEASTPQGLWTSLQIIETGPAEVRAVVVSVGPAPTDPATEVVLFAALAKGSVMDRVVERVSELGVSRVVPFSCQRSVPAPDAAGSRTRAERWRRIAAESCKQCGRTRPLGVDDPVDFAEVVRAAAEPGATLLLSPRGEGQPLSGLLEVSVPPVRLVVGPEGGLTRDEEDALVGARARRLGLGPRVLRCETAAVAASAVVLYTLGELGPIAD